MFVAPVGWALSSATPTFTTAVPDGVTFTRRTVTIAGQQRQAVVASWPNNVTWGSNETWPTMSVIARPTATVVAGTSSVATAYMGDSRHTWTSMEATSGATFIDAPNLDGDGSTTEAFASATQTVVVGAAGAMDVRKEICSPDPRRLTAASGSPTRT